MSELETHARALTYLRVSSKRQMDTAVDIDPDGNSIATQRDYVGRKAVALGTGIRQEFLEPGTSAQTIEKRMVFRQLLRFIQEHPDEIDYVIIYMRSRAFRNYIDAGVTERQLSKLGVKLVSAKEDFGEGIWGDAMKAVADIMNEVQVRMSGEDIRLKMEHKARGGGTIRRAPVGYKNVRGEHEGRLVNTIAVDEVRGPFIRQAFELYAEGDISIENLAGVMADLGLTTRPTAKWPEQPVSPSKLHTILRDPYYVGFVTYNDELIPGRHQPIVSQALFDQVQDVLTARSQAGQRDRLLFHYLKGMVFCARCQAAGRTGRLIYTEAKGRTGGIHPYFFCRLRQTKTCDLPYLPMHQVERAIEAHYQTLALPGDFIDSVQAALRETMEQQQESTQALHDTLRRQLARLVVQEERLVDLAADGSLPQGRIRARLNKIALDRQSIEEKLGRTGDELAAGAELLRTSLELSRDPAGLYRRAPDRVRRFLNETFFERFYVNEHGLVAEAELRPPFDEFGGAVATYYRRRQPGGQVVVPGADDGTNEAPGAAGGFMEPGREVVSWNLAEVFSVGGSNKTVMVGVTGFEPATSSSRTRSGWRSCQALHVPCQVRALVCVGWERAREHRATTSSPRILPSADVCAVAGAITSKPKASATGTDRAQIRSLS